MAGIYGLSGGLSKNDDANLAVTDDGNPPLVTIETVEGLADQKETSDGESKPEGVVEGGGTLGDITKSKEGQSKKLDELIKEKQGS